MQKQLPIFLTAGMILMASTVMAQNFADQKIIVSHELDRLTQNRAKAQYGHTVDGSNGVNHPFRFLKAKGVNKQVALSKSVRKASQAFEPGWTADFNTADQWSQFTIIDANGDATGTGSDTKGCWSQWINQGEGAAQYAYSKTNKADDWMVTPGINLKAGKSYYVRFKLRCVQPSYPERIEVKYGTAPTVDAMTGEVLAETEVRNSEYQAYEQLVTPASDGVYYFGFHALSDPFMYVLYVDDVAVIAAPEAASPAAVGNATATPSREEITTGSGRPKRDVTLSFTLPEKNFGGEALTSLSGVKIYVDGELMEEITDDLTIGGTREVILEDLEQDGVTNFTILPYNEAGDGEPVNVSAYVGLDLPSAPATVALSDDAEEMKLSWDEAEGAHDGAVYADHMTYHVYSVGYDNWGNPELGEELGSYKNATSMSLGMGADEGKPGMLELAVRAENETGISENATISNTVLVGTPETVPYHESFPGGEETHLLIPFAEGQGVTFGMAGAGRTVDESADNDGGSLYLQAFSNDSVGVNSFKVALAGTTAPKLAFRTKNAATTGTFYIYVKAPKAGTVYLSQEKLTTVDSTWQTRLFDLTSYKDERYVQVGFALSDHSDSHVNKNIFIDNIHIGDMVATDLAAAVTADRKVTRGEEAAVNVRVSNVGLNTVAGYTVQLLVDGDVVAEQSVSNSLSMLEVHDLSFTYSASKIEEKDQLDIVAVVTADGDEVACNNEATTTIEVVGPDLSKVQNLTASATQNGSTLDVVLSWEKPLPLVAKTETFEDYAAWTVDSIGDWTGVDGDGASAAGDFIYDSNGSEVMYEHEGESFGFIVFNHHNFGGLDLPTGGINTFAPHSGSQMAASIRGQVMNMYTFNMENTANNDWLISPELPGNAQNISFWVNNVVATNQVTGEQVDLVQTFDILYSTVSADTTTFILLDAKTAEGGVWQEVTVSLPEGAKYFAIRNKTDADHAYIFMVDDITYHLGGGEPVGYNVYRDGSLIGSTTELTYQDQPANGKYLYQVTALYEGGKESAPESVSAGVATGISTTTVSKATAELFTIDGVKVPAQHLKKGIYIMRAADGSTRKVLVK